MPKMTDGLLISDVARRAGVNIQTLRFYERRGLLAAPPRSASGYRRYPEDSVRVVQFIRRAQELGFSLREVQELMALRERRQVSCREVRAAAEAKLVDVRRRIRRLEAMREALEGLVRSCRRGAAGVCPIIESLDEPAPRRRGGWVS